ncbi:shikimate kinase [Paenibacillus shunpengii]|uniref:Shikimate kinase n=1 Tax=Paenibacillus shunpengii TaxID=2054424 RepID=A0ABW5SRS1_9BACL
MSRSNENIVLIGMMGTGKTTVSSLLADRLGYKLVDIDAEIEAQEDCPIPVLFEQKGEAYFREVETSVLLRVLDQSSQIISTGGGSVLKPLNCDAMKKAGWVVALTASAEAIIRRVSANRDRPLLAGNVEERVHQIMRERQSKYSFADLTVDTSEMEPEEVVCYILAHHRV